MATDESLKKAVQDFWNQASCGENLYLPTNDRAGYLKQSKRRYELEPYIEPFAKFDESHGLPVLEIGVGLGADHQRFAEAGSLLHGVDLTERAVEHTSRRLRCFGLESRLMIADAENLPFPAESFAIVYSWGVFHHSPDTQKAIDEVCRVLRPGGVARIMVYHFWSLVGAMLWVRYGLLRLQPWASLISIYAQHLESPGTKAYTVHEVRRMFCAFEKVETRIVLSHADMLESEAGQRHQGILLNAARRVWPRGLIRRFLPNTGLFLLIEATKGSAATSRR
jgi:SAM-dependent methyltransferase